MDSDLSRLIGIAQLTLPGDAWEHRRSARSCSTTAQVSGREPGLLSLTGSTREEITERPAGHDLVLEEMSEADFIHRITDGHHRAGLLHARPEPGVEPAVLHRPRLATARLTRRRACLGGEVP